MGDLGRGQEEEGPAAPAGGFQGDEGDSEDGSEQDSEDEGVQVLQTAGNQLVRTPTPL